MNRKRTEPLNFIEAVPALDCLVMVLESPRYGRRIVLISSCDLELIAPLKWHLHSISGKLYVTARSNGKTISLHRLIMGFPSGMVIDHKDGNTMNNLRSNLRICTQADNLLNRKNNRESSTGLKGVFKSGRRFRSYIGSNGVVKYLGSFETKEQAAKAYNEAAQELHGQFARLNQVAA